MFALIFAALMPTALAQNEAALDAIPEGCWGTVLNAAPAAGADDVPIDVAPRFFMEGTCDVSVLVELRDTEQALIDTSIEIAVLSWGTSFIVHPGADLSPNADYTLVILPDFGTEVAIPFTTGDLTTEDPAALTTGSLVVDGWCTDRNAAGYQAMIELFSEDSGFIGYITGQPDAPWTYTALFMENGEQTLWVPVVAELGDEATCLYTATIGDNGDLSAWEETCADVPNIGECRRGLFRGCNQQATNVRSGDAWLLLPLLPLIGLLRRRRQD